MARPNRYRKATSERNFRMNEVEKLYENCGIYPDCRARECGLDYCANSSACGYAVYPEFTAEKQLELIKWLIQNKRLCIHKAEYSDNFYMDTTTTRLNGVDNSSFEECLASMLNLIWQDLTEEEKEQIKGILEWKN